MTDPQADCGFPTQDSRRIWQPLLEGDQLIQSLLRIRQIADTVGPVNARASLANGAAGLALFHAYLADAHPEMATRDDALRLLEYAMDQVATMPMTPSLYEGFTGVAWAIAHLEQQTDSADENDPLIDVDDLLLRHIEHTPYNGDYDLIFGLVGFGLYALERLPRPGAVGLLTCVIERLAERAIHTSEGVTWLTPPHLLPPYQRELFPNGHYNLGMAHGVPGVIALLGLACQAGVAERLARPLLNGAVSWLLAQALPPESSSAFSPWIAPDSLPTPARTAWCYGDPGVAAALLLAARCTGETAWEESALTIARRTARRALSETGITDASLCHGAAGLGHLFHRLFRTTDDPLLGEAARFWFGQALTHHSIPEQDGFLTGAAGIGLALLAAVSPVEPRWDRVLLLSGPANS